MMPQPFSLELARQGHPLVTRDGRKVEAVAYFGSATCPVAAVVALDGGPQWIAYDSQGCFFRNPGNPLDLLLADLPDVEETVWLYRASGAGVDPDFAGNLWRTEQRTPHPGELVTIRRKGTWKAKDTK